MEGTFTSRELVPGTMIVGASVMLVISVRVDARGTRHAKWLVHVPNGSTMVWSYETQHHDTGIQWDTRPDAFIVPVRRLK
jgi:hypothetical protein